MCFTDHLVPVYDFQIIELVNVSLQKGSVSKLEQLSIIDGIQTSNTVNTHTSDTSFRQINLVADVHNSSRHLLVQIQQWKH